MNTVIEKPKTKKLTLVDLEIASFVTSSAIRNMMFITNDPNCAEVGGVYAAQTGNTQCKAHGGCIDATNGTACNTHAANCDQPTDVTCGDTVACTVGCSAVC